MIYCKMSLPVLFTLYAVLKGAQYSYAAPQNNRPVLNLTPQSISSPPVHSRFNFIDHELMKHTAESAEGNFMISPASIKSSLGMLLEGAKGTCADELRKNLRLSSDEKVARQQLTGFLSELQVHTPGIVLESVNRIFLSHRLTPKQEYVNLLNDVYFSRLERVDFSQGQKTANEVNKWINASTRGLIPTLVEPNNFEADTVMLIANALYFKGTWENAFDEKMTSTKCFQNTQGCYNTRMMETQAEFNYGQINELAAQAIEMPYQGDRYSMLILLPVEKQGLNILIKDLPSVPLPQILAHMERTDVQVSMPRFNVDYAIDLVSILRNIGIREVFTSTANLSGIVEGGVTTPQVNNFFHKTRIEVNEQGSVAAAATGAMVVPLMSSTTDRMSIDHPFLFFIRDMKTGAVLFEGRVEEPELASNNVNQKPDYSDLQLEIFTSTESNRPFRNNQGSRQPSSYADQGGILFEPASSPQAGGVVSNYSPTRNSQPIESIGTVNRFEADNLQASSQQVRHQRQPSSNTYNSQNTRAYTQQRNQNTGKRLTQSSRMPIARSISQSSLRPTIINDTPQNVQPLIYMPPALRFATIKTHPIPVKGVMSYISHPAAVDATNNLASDFQKRIPIGAKDNSQPLLLQTASKHVENNFQRPLPADNDGIRFTL